MAGDDEDDTRMEMLYSELSDISEHPFDLNTVKAGDLRRLPFLTDEHINSILSHIKRYGKMVSIYELKDVKGLNHATRELLLPFVHVPEKEGGRPPLPLKYLPKYGRHEILLRYDRCLQQKKGYRDLPDSIAAQYPNRKYLGEQFYHSLRYTVSLRDKLQAGITAEKDAGEALLNKNNKGYDFYSAHFLLKNTGILQSIALGDYKATFGQGLTISSEFVPSHTSTLVRQEKRTHGFTRHASANEYDFLRGAALTLDCKNINISAFYSLRHLDAAVTDSNYIASIKTDGLHNLPREMQKKHTLKMQTIGGNILYSSAELSVGLTAINYRFVNHKIIPKPQPRNIFLFRGHENTNISADYTIRKRNIMIFGETAISANKAIATLNAIKYYPTSRLELLFLHRYYDRQYQAFFANAFSQSTTTQNEEGFYAAMRFNPFADLLLSAYIDSFRHPWLKFGIDAPSTGIEYMAQVDYPQSDELTFYIRYKYRQKEKNAASASAPHPTMPCSRRSLRLHSQYRLGAIDLKTAADGVAYSEAETLSRGIAISQSAGCAIPRQPLQINLYAAWFNAPDGATRLISLEKSATHAYSRPQLCGKGLRLATLIRWDILKCLALTMKIGNSHYSDRETINSDLEEIEGQDKTDIQILMRWKI
jgi:hypothetical protein